MRESLRDNGGLTTNSRGGEKQTSLIRFNLRHNNGRNTLPSSPGARRRCSTGHIGRSSALTCYCTARHGRRGLRRTLTCPSPTLCGTAPTIQFWTSSPRQRCYLQITERAAATSRQQSTSAGRSSMDRALDWLNKCRTPLHGQGIGLAQQVPSTPPWTGHWTGSGQSAPPWTGHWTGSGQ